MSADPRPSLSESARAALLADRGVLDAMLALQKSEGSWAFATDDVQRDHGSRLVTEDTERLMFATVAAYSAYLARTPLEGTPNPVHFLHIDGEQVWCVSCKGWIFMDGGAHEGEGCQIEEGDESKWKPVTIADAQEAINALAEKIRELDDAPELRAASLQERIAALIDENTKLKCELDGAMDGAACDLETIRHKTAEVAALTAEREALSADYQNLLKQSDGFEVEVTRLRAENTTLTADRDRLDWLESRRDEMQIDTRYYGTANVMLFDRRIQMISEGMTVRLAIDSARTPPVPEDTKHAD